MAASGFDALTRRIFGDAPDDATKRTRDADRQREARLASLFHDADTQADWGCVKDLGQFLGLLIMQRLLLVWWSVSASNGVR